MTRACQVSATYPKEPPSDRIDALSAEVLRGRQGGLNTSPIKANPRWGSTGFLGGAGRARTDGDQTMKLIYPS